MTDNPQKAIEAVLFAYGEPISIAKLSGAVGKSKKTVEENLRKLQERLEKESGLRILNKDGKVQLVTASDHAPQIEKLFKAEHREGLGKAGLEVLAIIAYAGPISRSEIETIRGVNSAYTIRNLMMRGLIEDGPITDSMDTYIVTHDFVKFLGIEKPEDLPDYEKLNKDKNLEDLLHRGEEEK